MVSAGQALGRTPPGSLSLLGALSAWGLEWVGGAASVAGGGGGAAVGQGLRPRWGAGGLFSMWASPRAPQNSSQVLRASILRENGSHPFLMAWVQKHTQRPSLVKASQIPDSKRGDTGITS